MNAKIDLSNWVVVFDIDDTLISEFDYRLSGLEAIESLLLKTHNRKFNGEIIEYINSGKDDYLGKICEIFNFPNAFKESLLWTYRLHYPNIKLQCGVDELIKLLNLYNANLAILSDGRSISQRLKLKAVGLNKIPCFISEEFDSDKFSKTRFLEIQKLWPKKKYAYIADNPKKDFFVCSKLGWLSIGADWVLNKVHQFEDKDVVKLPDFWVKNPAEIIEILYKNNEKKLNN